MVKKELNYIDLNGQLVMDELYFNYSAKDLVDLQRTNSTFANVLKKFQEEGSKSLTDDEMYDFLVDYIVYAYGVKSPDGKRLIKNDKIREEFKQSLAFDKIFMQFLMDKNMFAKFAKEVMPDNMPEIIKAAEVNGLELEPEVKDFLSKPSESKEDLEKRIQELQRQLEMAEQEKADDSK